MRAPETLALALCAWLGGCGACEPNREPPTKSEASSPSVSAASAAPGASHAEHLPIRRAPGLPCRAITVEGEVTVEHRTAPPLAVAAVDALDASGTDAATPLARASEVPPDGWIALAPASRLVVKDPRTTRETTWLGPGLARVCVDLSEEAWLWSGTFESTSGSGEAPGAEQWVVTPLGVVRFGAAALEVSVSAGARGVGLNLSRGTAFVWPARDATVRAEPLDSGTIAVARSEADGGPLDEGWSRIASGGVRLSPGSSRQGRAPEASTPAAASAAIQVCAGMGRSARELAESLLAGDAGAAAAQQQVAVRRLARAACAVAALRVEMLAPQGDKTGLAASLADASALWRTPPLLR